MSYFVFACLVAVIDNLWIWSPQGKIVPQELHDEGTVFVWFFTQSV